MQAFPVDAGPAGPATKVLLVGADRRFRTVAAALLERRGYVVSVPDRGDLVELAGRTGAQVVVVDAAGLPAIDALGVARLEASNPGIGIVVVSDAPGEPAPSAPVLPKWGSFDALSEAIDDLVGVRAA
jgi:CheY-like chemotaxis protein